MSERAWQLSSHVRFSLLVFWFYYTKIYFPLSGQTSGVVSWSIAACQNFGRADGGAADG